MKKRKYNHLAFLSVNEQIEIREKIHEIKPTNNVEIRNKEILELYFIDGYGAREISEMNLFKSRNGGYLGKRMIQLIVKEHFPDVFAKRDKPESKKSIKRKVSKNVSRIREGFNAQMCCKCGSFLEVEMHHMIPVDIGGTDDIENLMPLCEECHREYTLYYVKHKKDIIKRFAELNADTIAKIITKSLQKGQVR